VVEGRAPRLVQLACFSLLAAVLTAVMFSWALSPIRHAHWSLTPVAFAALTIALSVPLAFSLWRRPSRGLTVAAVALLSLGAMAEIGLDLSLAAVAPLLGAGASVACVYGGQLAGEARSGARHSSLVLAAGAIALLLLLLAGGWQVTWEAWGGKTTFARVASPQATWVAIGYTTNAGATDSGSTEVYAQREFGGVLRVQVEAFSALELVTLHIRWRDATHLAVGGRVVSVAGW
jgi:hypothetical protein